MEATSQEPHPKSCPRSGPVKTLPGTVTTACNADTVTLDGLDTSSEAAYTWLLSFYLCQRIKSAESCSGPVLLISIAWVMFPYNGQGKLGKQVFYHSMNFICYESGTLQDARETKASRMGNTWYTHEASILERLTDNNQVNK